MLCISVKLTFDGLIGISFLHLLYKTKPIFKTLDFVPDSMTNNTQLEIIIGVRQIALRGPGS